MRPAGRKKFEALRLLAGPAVLLTLLAGTSPVGASGLQPYQMTRSLQLVQDRIAGGDHAALPMQRRLVEMIDERLRRTEATDFEDDRNFNALLIYGMSGGNPSTFETVLARLELEDERRSLAHGVRDYLVGNPGAARNALLEIDIEALPGELAAFTALVKGSVISPDDPALAIELLDRARLLSPGTLVEEAALRRALTLHVEAGDADRFLRAATQYARRFLRSPYASQFAQTLVAGTADMFDHIDRRRIEQILATMTQEQARTIYLRLARRAAIDGQDSLLEFASARARRIAGEMDDGEDVRSLLYSSIASVTSDTVDTVLFKLRQIDRRQLSSSDRVLLDAAEAVASEVVARPRLPDTGYGIADEGATANRRTISPEAMDSDQLVTTARERLDAIDRMLERDVR
jgi:chemotaxis protein MotC